jgi:hypothetical protein
MVCGQRHFPSALTPGKTRYPLCRGLGEPQSLFGRVQEIAPPLPEFDPQTVQPVVSSYVGPQVVWCEIYIKV